MSETPIELGLRSSAPLDPALRTAIQQLFTILHDTAAFLEVGGTGTLRTAVQECLEAFATADGRQAILELVERCCSIYRRALASADRESADHERELKALLQLVREALAAVGGDAERYDRQLESSMGRFEAISHISDARQLKALILDEVGTLRAFAVERKRQWETTTTAFNTRIATLERQLQTARREAAVDPLTQVANRGAFDLAVREWLGQSAMTFVIAMVDVDNFKRINDSHGHATGDQVLTAVAHTLKSSIRSSIDTVGRLGGDEFVCLMRDVTLRPAENRLKMVVKALSSMTFDAGEGQAFRISISCGLVEYSAGDTVESLMERADLALYEAKRLGRNCVVAKAKPTLHDLLRR